MAVRSSSKYDMFGVFSLTTTIKIELESIPRTVRPHLQSELTYKHDNTR